MSDRDYMDKGQKPEMERENLGYLEKEAATGKVVTEMDYESTEKEIDKSSLKSKKSAKKGDSSFSSSMGNFIKYIGKHKKFLYAAVILSFASSILNLAGPNLLSKLTDQIEKGVTGGMDWSTINNIGITLTAIYLLAYVIATVSAFIVTGLSQRVGFQMRSDINKKLNRLPLSYFDQNSRGDIMSRVLNDANTVTQGMDSSFTTVVSSVTLIIGSAVMMLWTNFILGIATILTAMLSMFVAMGITKASQRYFKKRQKELGQLNGHIEEMYTGYGVIKAYCRENWALKNFDEMNEKLFKSNSKAYFLSTVLFPAVFFIGNLAYIVICLLGFYLVLEGKTEIGTLVAFFVYVRLFTQPLGQLSQAMVTLQSLSAAGERVIELLDTKEMDKENPEVKSLDKVKGQIDFDNVCFSYEPGKEIIHHFNAHVKPGQKVAIVGETGAGKTTLVNLLMRFYEIDSGDIKIDGVSIKSMSREYVRELFGMVLQDTWVFEGTLRDNLVYNKKGISDDKLMEVCHSMDLETLVHQLPNGFDSMITSNANLSNGQKQLITLARAMIEDAPLLILDEATSSIDTRTELMVQAAMDKLMKGRTSFVIAHRLSTIENADMILVMKSGDIIEQGNHKELLALGGYYSKLYYSSTEEE